MVGDVPVYSTEISVRYAETDRMGVAHHSSYLLWFELGRTGLLREIGHAYRDLEKAGVMLPVIEYTCELSAGAEYDDVVRIETRIDELKSRTILFSYRVLRGDQTLAVGRTKHLCVDAEHHFRRIPPDIAEALAPYVGGDERPSPRP